ncbi:cell polarity protein-like protein [Dothidotthia symphoricarpi CBS 119687]|uniref:Cell polarity protein-like protein n=1 Tax=Dothidotthia symphoricarpi CBS 119687 TaxID=1392245 RepID=A0A6A6ALK4_9PLEO|nr:cell polarity protein-like protein [Dothidotthia symphoricarpi CBS 119687]KAF2131965.1 cell polarity protein-like protein [Dothidotthia symphoricarpi CBS 119687]
MSFLFGKKSKPPTSALPPAVREISSSNGQGAPPTSLNGALREPDKSRPGPQSQPPQSQTPTPGGSVNTSLSSLQGPTSATPPEPKSLLRERAESNLPAHNAPQTARITGAAQDSPYPWSSRRLNFTGGNPFPRYGAAINATASKDGTIYLMGGLVGGATVKGDLWLTEMGNGTMACYPISTTGDGPGPRVGHASLLVGNAFIVFGGDTKLADNDDLDDTLYLLNTSTKHWSRALPQGPRPTGRYGHTLNILGSKIYIFGGQVEGFFFNDLVAFDLNSLQSSASRWEVLLPNTKDQVSPHVISPPARTNHSVVTWNDKLYLFGGTDGVTWFNDVWTYEPRSNAWTELDCIGYIPVAREGHSAALVNDTMYIFGGRTQDGVDLGDLAAFRISSRRWYMFQNMGHSPSARSGHSMTAFGKHVVVLAGEPSSSASERNELSLAYVLDTSKIRYPPNESALPQQALNTPRKMSGGDRSNNPPNPQNGPNLQTPQNFQGRIGSPPARESMVPGPPHSRAPDAAGNGLGGNAGSRLPRAAGPAPAGPPMLQQPPHPRSNEPNPQMVANSRSKTPTKVERTYGPVVDTGATSSLNRENLSPITRDSPSTTEMQRNPSDAVSPGAQKESMDTSRSGSIVSRNTSRSHRQQQSQDSVDQTAPRRSTEAQQQHATNRDFEPPIMEKPANMSPAISQRNNELVQELETVKGRNAWYASELALARKAGYHPGPSTSPVFDERSADSFRDEDRPLVEALLKMKTELDRVQTSIKSQGNDAAKKIAEIERQRDAAVSEAIYAKTKLAAHGGGSQNGTPQLDGARNIGTPDMDRLNDTNRRLAVSLASQSELSAKVERLTHEIQSERRAKQLAEETAEAAQKRMQELNSTRQQASAEFESLRAELHEAERVAREVSANAAAAESSSKLLAIDKQELGAKVVRLSEESKNHTVSLVSLRDAMVASSERSILLEKQLEEDRQQGDSLRQKLAQLRAEHEARTTELETANQKLHDAEELAERYAEEARFHRQAVLSGLGNLADHRDIDQDVVDERVTILQQQAEAAHTIARKNQAAADQASEKLRRAEERIAGLEAYQEQSSREGLTIRKQLQHAMRDMQTCEAEKVELRQQYERLRLESNAFEVQLRTLKNLLDERGVNHADARRSRVLESPNSRFGTPELNRVRELEQQIDSMNKAHEELRTIFEQREHDVSKDWEEKLQALHNDHQAAVKYLRGTEKMLTKMKQELDRYKTSNTKLEEELTQTRGLAQNSTEPPEWEAEREALETELSNVQENMKRSVARLEGQIAALQAELTGARNAVEVTTHNARQATSAAEQHRTDLEALRRQYALVEERAREAEHRVQMFLDQFETSVDNYRRQSHVPVESVNGEHMRHRTHDSVASVESLYSRNDGSSTPEAAINNRPASSATRNSMALDNLASELDALRSHWETTNKAYRLSDHFNFDRTPTNDRDEHNESLAQWRQRIGSDAPEDHKGDREAPQQWTNAAPSSSSTLPGSLS